MKGLIDLQIDSHPPAAAPSHDAPRHTRAVGVAIIGGAPVVIAVHGL